MFKVNLPCLLNAGILVFSWSCQEAKAEMSHESLKK
jgi:hypothetical protein